jgi:hypothetical protein
VAAMKFATARPYANPEAAARKLIEIANSVEAVQDGRIHIALLNGHQSDSKQQSRDSSGPRGIRSGNLLRVKDFYLPNVKREEARWQLTGRRQCAQGCRARHVTESAIPNTWWLVETCGC